MQTPFPESCRTACRAAGCAVAAALLAACSAAGWQGYGPQGEGFIGSAYGYTDRRLSDTTWQVEYVDGETVAAQGNAIRRANELCVENGFARADFTPALSTSGGIVKASGIATCTAQRKAPQAYSERAAIEQRMQEIDTQIEMLHQRSADMGGSAGRSGTWLDIFSSATEKLGGTSYEKQISALEDERQTLLLQLQQLPN